MLLSEMQEIEMVLSRRAASLGVEIKRGAAVTGFNQTEGEVTVLSGENSFKCKWLVGCDGARSTVRKIGGFEFAGSEPEFTGYSTKVDIKDPSMLSPGRNVTEKGMYLQSQPSYVIIQDFDGGAFHHSEKPITLEHVQDVLRRISNTEVTINTLHIAATLQSRAPEGLLESYQTERHPIGEQVLDWSRAQVAIMKPGSTARALNAIVRDLMNTRDGATYFAARVWGIFTRYNLGGDHSLIGQSVPNFEMEEGAKMGELMRDGRGILLDFSRNVALKSLADEYGDRLKYISGQAKDSLGLGALLIRPDGFIAWACEGEPREEPFRKSADLWFARTSEG